jgi:hypothetical protein
LYAFPEPKAKCLGRVFKNRSAAVFGHSNVRSIRPLEIFETTGRKQVAAAENGRAPTPILKPIRYFQWNEMLHLKVRETWRGKTWERDLEVETPSKDFAGWTFWQLIKSTIGIA